MRQQNTEPAIESLFNKAGFLFNNQITVEQLLTLITFWLI